MLKGADKVIEVLQGGSLCGYCGCLFVLMLVFNVCFNDSVKYLSIMITGQAQSDGYQCG